MYFGKSNNKNGPVAGWGQEREFSGPSDFGQFWGVESESECYSVRWGRFGNNLPSPLKSVKYHENKLLIQELLHRR